MMKKPRNSLLFLAQCLVLILSVSASPKRRKASPPMPSPAPAPAPAPAYANLTALLEHAGPFGTFLSLLDSTGVMKTVQDQANNTATGLTMFVPSDKAFSALPKNTLAKLSADQSKALLLAHCISKFYSLEDFQNFSNPASTMATGLEGGKYNLNITAKNGAVSVSSGAVTTPIASAVLVTDPAAVYSVGKVLLPEDIFGAKSPSYGDAAPAPSPSKGPAKGPKPKGLGDHPSPVSAPAESPDGSPSAASFLQVPGHFFVAAAALAGAIMLV